MKRRGLQGRILESFFYFLSFLFLIFGASHVSAATTTWTGPHGGIWSNPANWDTNMVPTAADDVYISSSTASNGAFFVVYVDATTTIDFATMTIATGTLRLRGNIGTGSNIILENGESSIKQNNTAQQVISGNFTILADGRLMDWFGDVTEAHTVNIKANNFYFSDQANIYGNRGYNGGFGVTAASGPGAGGSSATGGGGGGGHGGAGGAGGGTGPGAGGVAYCNINDVSTYGSGGGYGAGNSGNQGAGLIKLRALDSIVFTGTSGPTFAAVGLNGYSNDGGGGAGGGIKLVANTVTGTVMGVRFSAGGGDGGAGTGGGGGGGCISVKYITTSTVTTANMSAPGGAGGGTGMNGSAGLLSVVQFSTNSTPGTPTSTSNIATNSITYNWSAADSDGYQTYYLLERSDDAGMTFSFVATTTVASTSYAFTGLSPDKAYVFRVAAGDGANPTSSYVTSSPTYTLANPAAAPTLSNAATSSIQVTINTNGNPTNTFYAIYNATSGNFLTASGTATSSPVYFTTSTWNDGRAYGLTPSTSHQFSVVARNGGGINAATSSLSSALSTLAVITPNTPSITASNPTTSTLQLAINTNGNSVTTTYAILNVTTGMYLTTTGTPTSSPVFFTSSTWGNTSSHSLSLNTAYQYKVIAQSTDIIFATSATSTAVYTLSNPALSVTAANATNSTSSLSVAWDTNGNPSSSVYSVYSTGTAQYFTSAGTPTTTPTYFTSSSWGGSARGLTPNTLYQFIVTSANGDGVTSASSSASNATSTRDYFYPIRPTTPTVSNPTTSSLKVTINTNGNTVTTTYSILNITTGNYVAATGGPTSTPAYFTSTTWNNGFATGLNPNTSYQFVVTAQSTDGFASSSPTSTALYTLANSALAPTVTANGTSTLNLVINTNSNPAITTYAIYNTSTGQYVTATGTASMTPVFYTSSTWGGVVNGLSVNTPYQFGVIASNADGVASATSSLNTAVYTLANPASPVTVTSSGTSTLTLQFGANGNPTSTMFAIFNATVASYLDAMGAPTSSAFYQSASSWGTYVTSTGLSVNTAYQFAVIARNGGNVLAASTTATSVYTWTQVPTGLTTTARTASSITLGWSGNGSQYYLENTSNSTNSGWISGTSYTFTSLTCNSDYTVRIKARNGDTVETAFAPTTTATTDACSSGGSTVVAVPAGGGGGVYGGTGSTSPAPTSTAAPTSTQQPTSSLPSTQSPSSVGGLTIDQLFPGFGTGVLPQFPQDVQRVVPATISFYSVPVTMVRAGSSFNFRYTVTNTTTLSRTVRVERVLIAPNGSVLTRTSAVINQRSGQVFTSLPRVTIGSARSAGTYVVRVRVLTTTGRVIAENSFKVGVRR